MFEQTFKNIDDILHKDAGCSSELDYTEQTSWMLFLKYLDDFEQERAMEAEMMGEDYPYIIDEAHRWSAWAAPKDANGSFDHNTALTGDDLMDYVDGELFPYLKGFKQRATGPDTIEYKIGEIFGEIKNKIQSGYSLRDALEKVDELRFRSQQEKHELSHLYETKIKNMGNAGRNGGEYYTPRPLIRAMIDVIQPQIGETIYDGAAGSAGFLCEAYDYLRKGSREQKELSTSALKTLQEKTFYAKEKKSLAYVIAIMNMILHGIEAPNVVHTNTLGENLQDIQPSNQHDIILANPPFGGKERKEVQQNFPIKTGETAFLFLQHFIKMLKPGGRAAIVIKNTFLSNTDNAAVALRRELLENCNLHTILDCPAKTFLGAGVKTVVLFFTKGEPTQKIWYYQLEPGRSLGKTNPLNDADMAEFVELQKTFADSEKSWTVSFTDIIQGTEADLSVKNPNIKEETTLREPADIIAGQSPLGKNYNNNGEGLPFYQGKKDFGKTHLNPPTKWTTQVTKTAELGDILMSVRAPVGPVNFATQNICIGRGLAAIRPNEKLDRNFLFYYFSHIEDQISGTEGAVFASINKSQIESLPITLPPPPEQKRIVALLDSAFADIEKARTNAEKNLKNARELFESYLQKAFSQSGAPAQIVRLSEITKSISDGDHAPPPKAETGIPFITISNINKKTNEVDFSNTFKVSKSYFDSLKDNRKPIDGDILYTVTGSYGIPVPVSGNKQFCFQRHIGLIRPLDNIDTDWLYFLLMSPIVFKQADSGATGTAQKTVSLNVLRNIKVPLMPIEKQKEVAVELKHIQDLARQLESNYSSKLHALDELKKSLLHKAFTGQLSANTAKASTDGQAA